jgi:hypothetical protein
MCADSSFVPPLVYALMGSSKDLAVGTVAVASLLIGSMLSSQVSPTENPTLYMNLAFTATFFAGVFQASLGLLRYAGRPPMHASCCVPQHICFELNTRVPESSEALSGTSSLAQLQEQLVNDSKSSVDGLSSKVIVSFCSRAAPILVPLALY